MYRTKLKRFTQNGRIPCPRYTSSSLLKRSRHFSNVVLFIPCGCPRFVPCRFFRALDRLFVVAHFLGGVRTCVGTLFFIFLFRHGCLTSLLGRSILFRHIRTIVLNVHLCYVSLNVHLCYVSTDKDLSCFSMCDLSSVLCVLLSVHLFSFPLFHVSLSEKNSFFLE